MDVAVPAGLGVCTGAGTWLRQRWRNLGGAGSGQIWGIGADGRGFGNVTETGRRYASASAVALVPIVLSTTVPTLKSCVALLVSHVVGFRYLNPIV